jgi:hypothetical protein
MFLGLFASAVSPSPGAAPMITIILIIPCVVLSGALVQLPPAVSAPSMSYWSFKALVAVSGVGSDAAADACWQMPQTLRQKMTVDDKTALGCRCMGLNLFAPGSCAFPGNGKYAVPELSQAAPQPPTPPGEPPAEPRFGDPPAQPSDAYDKVKVAAYLNTLQAYQTSVAQTRDAYKQDLDIYQNQMEIYQIEMKAFQANSARWYVARAAAIGSGEANIKGYLDRFGWAFVDKSNRAQYLGVLRACWQAQGVIIAVLLAAILLVMKAKDR